MQQTNQYKLNLIESGDQFSPAPLNENMEKVEAALKNHAAENQQSFAALEQAIQQAAAAGLQIATGSYVGNGKYGSSNLNTLTFPFAPMVVIVMCKSAGSNGGMWLQGITSGTSAGGSQVTLTWSGNSVSWYHFNNYSYQLNDNNVTYLYAAIGRS